MLIVQENPWNSSSRIWMSSAHTVEALCNVISVVISTRTLPVQCYFLFIQKMFQINVL